MWQKLLQFALTYVLEKLLKFVTNEWEEYKKDQTLKNDIKKKVKAIKDAKTKEEIRNAIRDLSI